MINGTQGCFTPVRRSNNHIRKSINHEHKHPNSEASDFNLGGLNWPLEGSGVKEEQKVYIQFLKFLLLFIYEGLELCQMVRDLENQNQQEYVL